MTDYKNSNNNSSSNNIPYKPFNSNNNNQILPKQGNNRKFNNNKSKNYDHKNDKDITQLESQLKQGKKINGNSRKNQISINHLLDFQSYRDTEEYAENQQRQKQRRRSSSHKKYQQVSKIHLTGMKFINVNFKFIVDSRKNYKIQEIDPNIPVDIKNIISIIAPKGASCPICLSDDLIAPRMIVSCGHILCLKCVLSLLEHEVPKAKKKESSAIIEKYRECPLCFSIIRKPELKPVIFDNVDERFEIPKVKDEVVLTLMARDSNKILSLPKSISIQNHLNDFPNVNQIELSSYSRIMKGDFDYLKNMYENEKQQILKNYEEEKLLYGDDNELVEEAISHIDKEIEEWSTKFAEPSSVEKTFNLDESLTHQTTFYYYQTGFNANTTYVLSPLDMKVLKNTYIDYQNLPSTIIAKIENIRYEELSSETSINKYKYLSHLPVGTQIGFLECNWNNNEFISQNTWSLFKEDLLKRSKNSNKKFNREERNKKKAQNEEELKTLQFYLKENGQYNDEEYDENFINHKNFNFDTLSIQDNNINSPVLSSDQNLSTTESENDYQTTVWGTKIPKSLLKDSSAIEDNDNNDDDWDAEEMIRKAREENLENDNESTNKKKKKKKRLVLLSS
ncbi:uncharacterized protein KGF55_000998 [Candida pseudojiufengensis]|uniref:uncharacterized protein n=1 Tax=Candida pseudojiufengensis TaxID=497109 RepID=UPI002225416E|nr:uncharacterized protein KGF55_000998 [Candida pseudojiufengensis]KAI5965636.1 hypothetical protein KGF55_000998 [Candida pseudojiufengensis]